MIQYCVAKGTFNLNTRYGYGKLNYHAPKIGETMDFYRKKRSDDEGSTK